MKISALGSFTTTVTGELPPLKGLVEETVGAPVRRIGRFIQLALVGAGRCVRPGSAPADTAVYLASGRGDLEVTLHVLEDMFVRHEAPMPLSFVNTVSNSACYYLARTLGLFGRSMFATSRYAPFESALRLAALDLAGGVGTALVGVVDVCVPPLEDHRRRVCVPPGTPVGEASHWLLLHPADAAGPCLGRIPLVRGFGDAGELQAWLRAQRDAGSRTLLAAGQHVDAALAADLAGEAACGHFDYRAGLPHYDCQGGAAVPAFLGQPLGERLVHVDGEPGGRFTVMVVERP